MDSFERKGAILRINCIGLASLKFARVRRVAISHFGGGHLPLRVYLSLGSEALGGLLRKWNTATLIWQEDLVFHFLV